jgi:TPR repeat protein
MRLNLRFSLIRGGLTSTLLLCAIATTDNLASMLAQAQQSPTIPDIATLQRKAQAGNAEAQWQLAGAYFAGNGVAKNPKQGVLWLRKSADQDYAWAEKTLGVMYQQGEQTISKNPREAALWFRKAARQQNKPAQTKLSEMLAAGVISKEEANWLAPEPSTKIKTATSGKTAAPLRAATSTTATSKPFSLDEVEKGLQGGITCKRLSALVDKFKVNFSLTTDLRERLGKAGADDNLLTTISASRRSL